MTDLVSRLRERHSFLCDEAAEEIERLHGIIADNSLLNRTDNERLRGLLREALTYVRHPDYDWDHGFIADIEAALGVHSGGPFTGSERAEKVNADQPPPEPQDVSR